MIQKPCNDLKVWQARWKRWRKEADKCAAEWTYTCNWTGEQFLQFSDIIWRAQYQYARRREMEGERDEAREKVEKLEEEIDGLKAEIKELKEKK